MQAVRPATTSPTKDGTDARQRANDTTTDARCSFLLARQRATACACATPHAQYVIDGATGTSEATNTIASYAGDQTGGRASAYIGGLFADSYGTACYGERAG